MEVICTKHFSDVVYNCPACWAEVRAKDEAAMEVEDIKYDVGESTHDFKMFL